MRGPASTSRIRADVGIDMPKIRLEGAVADLGDLPRHLHARRPAADEHEGEQARRFPVRLHFGRLKGQQQLRRTELASEIALRPGAKRSHSGCLK